jgi:hypothetical protein
MSSPAGKCPPWTRLGRNLVIWFALCLALSVANEKQLETELSPDVLSPRNLWVARTQNGSLRRRGSGQTQSWSTAGCRCSGMCGLQKKVSLSFCCTCVALGSRAHSDPMAVRIMVVHHGWMRTKSSERPVLTPAGPPGPWGCCLTSPHGWVDMMGQAVATWHLGECGRGDSPKVLLGINRSL